MGIIVGYEKEKEELANLHDMLKNAKKYREYGIRTPRGIIIYGEPGVGKTVLAKSIASEGVNLIELRSADCCEENAPDAIKEVFATAKKRTPSVILLDELDKIAGTSARFFMESNDAVKKTLLQELDSLNAEEAILVVATCNDTENLGDALLRSGRFDRQLRIELPDEETRKKILETYFSRLRISLNIDIEYIARITYGYTGAMLECLVNESGIMSMNKKTIQVDMDDIRIIMNRLAFGSTEKKPFKDAEQLRKIAVHEAGHALVALMLSPECIHGASVLPQGESMGHIKFINPENNIASISDMENEITILLAGRVAESIVFGEYSTGSVSDIGKAATKLHFLITNCASYGYETSALAVKTRINEDVVSQKIKYVANNLLKEKMEEFDHCAKNLILKENKVFEALIHNLTKKQTLTREELFDIFKKYSIND